MKAFFLLAALCFTFCRYSTAQVICILCYDQNDSISSGVNNLLVNGGFESGCMNGSFCPSSVYYTCDIPGWLCTGGGTATYAQVFDSTGAWYGVFLSEIVEGDKAAYLGNFYCHACSTDPYDTSCINNASCTIMSLPAGYPVNTVEYGGTAGVSMEQTVTGLVIGNTYVLEFWAGGEFDNGSLNRGVFAVDVGFGDTLLKCKATDLGDVGTTYIIEFNATSSSHTIKFTNWGHITYDCTELVLDNVRLYTLAELAAGVPSCGPSSPLSFAASDTDVCEKFCLSFFDSSANNPTAWEWHFPGGNPSSSTDQNPSSICYTTPGTYDVTLITTNASGNDTLTFYNYITVFPTPPFPTITQVGYTLTSSPSSSYQWQFNSVDIPGATDQSYTILQSGYYTVIVGDSNGCKNSLTQYVLISGIGDAASGADIFVYPNPSGGIFTVELWNAGTAGDVSIDVLNPLGQKVFSTLESRVILSSANGSAGPHWGKREIDLRNVEPGVYFVEIKTVNEGLPGIGVRKKIVIVK